VLITGAGGNLGRVLAPALVAGGIPHLFDARPVESEHEVVQGDETVRVLDELWVHSAAATTPQRRAFLRAFVDWVPVETRCRLMDDEADMPSAAGRECGGVAQADRPPESRARAGHLAAMQPQGVREAGVGVGRTRGTSKRNRPDRSFSA